MRHFIIAAVAVIALADPALAQAPLMTGQALTGAVFAFPGTSCPEGTAAYKGPEAALAAKSNAVFCTFQRKALVVPKDAFEGKCPAGLDVYPDASQKPPEDVVWCKLPQRTSASGTGPSGASAPATPPRKK